MTMISLHKCSHKKTRESDFSLVASEKILKEFAHKILYGFDISTNKTRYHQYEGYLMIIKSEFIQFSGF